MKIFRLISLILTGPVLQINLHGQSPELKELMMTSVCECFGEVTDTQFESMKECFIKSMMDHSAELEKHIDKSSALSAREQGYALGQQLMLSLQEEMIMNCDAYYRFFERLKAESMKQYVVKLSKAELKALNKEIKVESTSDRLITRAMHYFQAGKLKKALKDINGLRQPDSESPRTYFLLGLIKEEQGNYDEAIDWYQKSRINSGKPDAEIFINIAKRKKAKGVK